MNPLPVALFPVIKQLPTKETPSPLLFEAEHPCIVQFDPKTRPPPVVAVCVPFVVVLLLALQLLSEQLLPNLMPPEATEPLVLWLLVQLVRVQESLTEIPYPKFEEAEQLVRAQLSLVIMPLLYDALQFIKVLSVSASMPHR